MTGAVSGGLGQVFSAGGFRATVGNGALAGAGSGGVTSIINGDNFFQGVLKGAVIGGAVAGISYTINYYSSGANKTKYLSKNEVTNADNLKYDPSISREQMQNNVNKMRCDNFSDSDINQYGVGSETVGNADIEGYLTSRPGQQDYAYTLPKNFWSGKSPIVYSPISAQNNDLLALTMVHETGHAYSMKLGLIDERLDTDKLGISSSFNSTDHIAIAKLEHQTAFKNLASTYNKPYYADYTSIVIAQSKLSYLSRELVNYTYKKLFPIFDRFMFYTR